jgi:hypothetical protein
MYIYVCLNICIVCMYAYDYVSREYEKMYLFVYVMKNSHKNLFIYTPVRIYLYTDTSSDIEKIQIYLHLRMIIHTHIGTAIPTRL